MKNKLQDKSKNEAVLLMSKVPMKARNLCLGKLIDGSWEVGNGPGYKEGQGGRRPSSIPSKQALSTSKPGRQLEIGYVYGYPDHVPDSAAGKNGARGVGDLLQAGSRDRRPWLLCPLSYNSEFKK